MAKDFSDVQFVVGKRLTQVIEANLRRKFGKIAIVRPGEQPTPGVVNVLLGTGDKIKGFTE